MLDTASNILVVVWSGISTDLTDILSILGFDSGILLLNLKLKSNASGLSKNSVKTSAWALYNSALYTSANSAIFRLRSKSALVADFGSGNRICLSIFFSAFLIFKETSFLFLGLLVFSIDTMVLSLIISATIGSPKLPLPPFSYISLNNSGFDSLRSFCL